jgi:hypothetical protein
MDDVRQISRGIPIIPCIGNYCDNIDAVKERLKVSV